MEYVVITIQDLEISENDVSDYKQYHVSNKINCTVQTDMLCHSHH